MPILEVRLVDAVFSVVRSDGSTMPIRANGAEVRQFNAGWDPVCVVDAFAPLYLLCLRHADGTEASWVLDGDMLRLGDSITHVPDHDREPLYGRAEALLGLVFDRIVAAPAPERPDEADDLADLCDTTLRELVALVVPARVAGLIVVDLNDAAADGMLARFGLHGAACAPRWPARCPMRSAVVCKTARGCARRRSPARRRRRRSGCR